MHLEHSTGKSLSCKGENMLKKCQKYKIKGINTTMNIGNCSLIGWCGIKLKVMFNLHRNLEKTSNLDWIN